MSRFLRISQLSFRKSRSKQWIRRPAACSPPLASARTSRLPPMRGCKASSLMQLPWATQQDVPSSSTPAAEISIITRTALGKPPGARTTNAPREGCWIWTSRERFHLLGWGVSPAMTVKMVGIGSQYAVTEHDAGGHYLDGGKTYRLHLPAEIPVKDFWSMQVNDPQTRSLLQTDQQYPSLSSQKKDLVVNPDTSVDVYFGPKPPQGKESNWLQTIPGKGWFTWAAVIRTPRAMV